MYTLERDAHGFVCAISKDGQWLIHLQPGTVLTEHNIESIVRELNAGQAQEERTAREKAEQALEALAKAHCAAGCGRCVLENCAGPHRAIELLGKWALAQAQEVGKE